MQTENIACFGGPVDGQTLPLTKGPDWIDNVCLVYRTENAGLRKIHIYVFRTAGELHILQYAGDTLETVIASLNDWGCENVASIVEPIAPLFQQENQI